MSTRKARRVVRAGISGIAVPAHAWRDVSPILPARVVPQHPDVPGIARVITVTTQVLREAVGARAALAVIGIQLPIAAR